MPHYTVIAFSPDDPIDRITSSVYADSPEKAAQVNNFARELVFVVERDAAFTHAFKRVERPAYERVGGKY